MTKNELMALFLSASHTFLKKSDEILHDGELNLDDYEENMRNFKYATYLTEAARLMNNIVYELKDDETF